MTTTTTDHDIERYVDVDLYGVLHITAEAGADLIDRAYRVRMTEVHPDRVGAASTELAALVNVAGAILRQADVRARYDALRSARRDKHDGREGDERQRRLHDLERQLEAARQELAASQVELSASEVSRQRLDERLRLMSNKPWRQPARWTWASWAMGVMLGVVALSLILGMAGSKQIQAVPYTPPLVIPAPAAALGASLGADAEWPSTLQQLDRTWEQDWPRTIATLEGFLERWPSYDPAENKLYAALVADADAHIRAGEVGTGVAELEQAARLLPGRGEVWALLSRLAASANT